MEIRMPENAKKVIETLEAAGYEAYIVGGCVRDSILGREPGDWDITTAARPEQVKALFRRTIDTGIKHGTVTVMFGKEAYEVTTYRWMENIPITEDGFCGIYCKFRRRLEA